MYVKESDYNLQHGETSTERQNISVLVKYENKEYPISGTFYNYYQREKVDGRYTSNLPSNTMIFKTVVEAMPVEIPKGDYADVIIEIDGVSYSVRFVNVYTGRVVFTLKPYEDTEWV